MISLLVSELCLGQQLDTFLHTLIAIKTITNYFLLLIIIIIILIIIIIIAIIITIFILEFLSAVKLTSPSSIHLYGTIKKVDGTDSRIILKNKGSDQSEDEKEWQQ